MPPGADGAVAPSLAWKVCAVLPLVLLVVLMSVKVADGFGDDDSKKESSQAQEPGVIATTPSAPTASETPQTDAEKEAEIKSGAPKPSELPEGEIPTTAPSIPDTGFSIPPGPIDQTASPVPGPTKKPTKKPTPTPTPTPTPSEARDQCIAQGISALNIAALAACIADLMDPGN